MSYVRSPGDGTLVGDYPIAEASVIGDTAAQARPVRHGWDTLGRKGGH